MSERRHEILQVSTRLSPHTTAMCDVDATPTRLITYRHYIFTFFDTSKYYTSHTAFIYRTSTAAASLLCTSLLQQWPSHSYTTFVVIRDFAL